MLDTYSGFGGGRLRGLCHEGRPLDLGMVPIQRRSWHKFRKLLSGVMELASVLFSRDLPGWISCLSRQDNDTGRNSSPVLPKVSANKSQYATLSWILICC